MRSVPDRKVNDVHMWPVHSPVACRAMSRAVRTSVSTQSNGPGRARPNRSKTIDVFIKMQNRERIQRVQTSARPPSWIVSKGVFRAEIKPMLNSLGLAGPFIERVGSNNSSSCTGMVDIHTLRILKLIAITAKKLTYFTIDVDRKRSWISKCKTGVGNLKCTDSLSYFIIIFNIRSHRYIFHVIQLDGDSVKSRADLNVWTFLYINVFLSASTVYILSSAVCLSYVCLLLYGSLWCETNKLNWIELYLYHVCCLSL